MRASVLHFSDLLENTLDGEWGEGEIKAGHVPCYIIRGTDFVKLNRANADFPIRWIKQSAVERKKLGDFLRIFYRFKVNSYLILKPN